MMLKKRSMANLFVGFNNKASSDSDPARSPTSPLDHMVFSNISNPFLLSPKSPRIDSPRKSWDSDRVGLSLVDTLIDSRSVVFGSQMRSSSKAPKSHEITDGIQTMSCPWDIDFIHRAPKSNSQVLGSPPVVRDVALSNISGSLPLFLGSLSASDIEMSEDYTRITTHGPNPKTTHIFGDCVLESHPSELPDFGLKVEEGKPTSWSVKCPEEDSFPSLGSGDFLSSCYSCRKKLGDGEDIYMYKGEKAFCSSECRDQEIMAEENMEDLTEAPISSNSTIIDEISLVA